MLPVPSVVGSDDDKTISVPVTVTIDQFVSGAVKQHQGNPGPNRDDASDVTKSKILDLSIGEQVREILETEKQYARR